MLFDYDRKVQSHQPPSPRGVRPACTKRDMGPPIHKHGFPRPHHEAIDETILKCVANEPQKYFWLRLWRERAVMPRDLAGRGLPDIAELADFVQRLRKVADTLRLTDDPGVQRQTRNSRTRPERY